MKTIHLLNNLTQFFTLIKRLKDESRTPGVELIHYLKIQYNYITLEIKGRPENLPNAYEELLVQITYERESEKILLKEVYFAKDAMLEKCTPVVRLHSISLNWNTTGMEEAAFWSKELVGNLEIADAIAKIGYSCESGEYAPGYYSEIIVMENFITLIQLNYRNSRSIDHTSNYYLRDLKFILPVSGVLFPEKVHGTVQLGNMLVYFHDRSSANNKECGDLIEAKIQEEMQRYKEF